MINDHFLPLPEYQHIQPYRSLYLDLISVSHSHRKLLQLRMQKIPAVRTHTLCIDHMGKGQHSFHRIKGHLIITNNIKKP